MNRSWTLLLTAETVSVIGSQLTIVALPLTAVLLLGASPFYMGLLQACAQIPKALFSPFVGAFVDRHSKRRILIAANCISAIALAIVPIAYHFDALSIWLLAAIAFLATTISNAEGIALFSFIPQVVDSTFLAIANSRFASVLSVATIAGTALASALIAAVGAPGAIIADSTSFVIAALLIGLIRLPGAPHAAQSDDETYWSRLRDGFRFILRSPDLMAVSITAIFVNFFTAIFAALDALFVVRELGVTAPWFAMALTAGAIAGALGAFLSSYLSKFVALRGLLAIGVGLIAVSFLGVSLLAGSPPLVAVLFAGCCAVAMFGGLLVNVALGTLVQTQAPPNMLGCISGFLTSVTLAPPPIGALAGGILAEIFGIRLTLMGGAVGLIGIVACLLLRPLIRMGRRSVALAK